MSVHNLKDDAEGYRNKYLTFVKENPKTVALAIAALVVVAFIAIIN